MTVSPLLTDAHIRRLQENARLPAADHPPVVKLFNPAGPASWLVTELADDEDTLYGLADLGFGFPELGSFSLCELQSLELPFGLKIERDRAFSTELGLSIWAEVARSAGSIAGAEQVMAAVTEATEVGSA